MNVSKILKYSCRIPLVMRNSIEALSHFNRQAIVTYLSEYGSASFPDIQEWFDLEPEVLNHHICILLKYGLIYTSYNKNDFFDKNNNNEHVFYELSKLGKKVLNNLMSILRDAPNVIKCSKK